MAKFTIAEIARRSDNYKTFLSALIFSGLADIFTGEDEFTVFVPSEEAFKLMNGDKLNLLMSENGREKLKEILKQHIVKGKYDALDLEDIHELKALNGNKLRVAEGNGNIYISNAKIIAEDIEAKDGMIHIIDEVLIPEDIEL